jgi:hypothetical protein
MKDEWISVNERLPENGVLVHVMLIKSRTVEPLKRDGYFWYTADDKMYIFYTPTHWMPIETLKQSN